MQFLPYNKYAGRSGSVAPNAIWRKTSTGFLFWITDNFNRPTPAQNRSESTFSWIQQPMNRDKYAHVVYGENKFWEKGVSSAAAHLTKTVPVHNSYVFLNFREG